MGWLHKMNAYFKEQLSLKNLLKVLLILLILYFLSLTSNVWMSWLTTLRLILTGLGSRMSFIRLLNFCRRRACRAGLRFRWSAWECLLC